MSEPVIQEAVEPEAPQSIPEPIKPKQYLLMVDEASMAVMARLMPSLLFVAVEGLSMKDDPNHVVLVSPLPKPIGDIVPIPVEAAQ